jgi:hypothetical protein
MVACDIRPLAIVQGEGFKTSLKYIEPGYKVPAATHIGQLLSKKHQQGKEALTRKLMITTDIRTSCANNAYISPIAIYASVIWEMVSCILLTAPFHEQHTDVNTAE